MSHSLAAEGEQRWGWWETGGLLGSAAGITAGGRWHEGWVDEAQAWMLARDMGWWQLMLHGVRYEGTPGLWHTVLWVLARLGFRYTGMHWVAGLLAVAGGAMLLRFAPFPRYLKLLLPFTFFLAYQDAVVARGYVLYAGLGFAAAALLRREANRPLLLALLLGLIANISVHGCIASGGLAMVAGVQAWRHGWFRESRRYLLALSLLLGFWVVAVGTAAPPGDLDFAAAKSLHKAKIWVADSRGGHWMFGNDEIPGDPNPWLPHVVTEADAKESLTMRPGELAPIPSTIPHRSLSTRLWLHIANFLGLITFPLSTWRVLALAVVVLTVDLARRRENRLGWVALAPWGLMVLAFTKLYMAPRHAGMLFTSFLISLWLLWPERRNNAPARWQQVSLTVLLLLLACEQIGWTLHAVEMDKRDPYSGDWMSSHFLKETGTSRIAAFYYHATGALAFLPGFKYMNQPHSYWVWSTKVRTDQQAPAMLQQHPEYVVVGGFTWGDQGSITVDWADPLGDLPFMPNADSYRIIPYFENNGYIESHRMCGRLLMREGYSEEVCNVVLEPYVPED